MHILAHQTRKLRTHFSQSWLRGVKTNCGRLELERNNSMIFFVNI